MNLAHYTNTFESMAAQNGTLAWREDDLMQALGYSNRKSFRKVVLRAMQACLTLNADPTTEFIRTGDSYKFTRFACYLVAMNGDVKKPQVAMAQVYLGSLADSFYSYREHAEIVDRVVIREEMKGGLKALSKTAKEHGVQNYKFFMNAGYRGMYNNMNLSDIEKLKGVKAGEDLIDRMDRTELAANLFRVTLTDNKIHKDDVRGQAALENTAYQVGKVVRDAVITAGGSRPEDLPLAPHIKEATKMLKSAGKRLKKISKEEVEGEILYLTATDEDFASERDPGYTKDPEEDESEYDIDE